MSLGWILSQEFYDNIHKLPTRYLRVYFAFIARLHPLEVA